MTFEEWYKEEYPDLLPEHDDFLIDLKRAFDAGYRAHFEERKGGLCNESIF